MRESRIPSGEAIRLKAALQTGNVAKALKVFLGSATDAIPVLEGTRLLSEVRRAQRDGGSRAAWAAIGRPDVLSGLIAIGADSDDLILQTVGDMVKHVVAEDHADPDVRSARNDFLPFVFGVVHAKTQEDMDLLDAESRRIEGTGSRLVDRAREGSQDDPSADPEVRIENLIGKGEHMIATQLGMLCLEYMELNALPDVEEGMPDEVKSALRSAGRKGKVGLRNGMMDICYGCTLTLANQMHRHSLDSPDAIASNRDRALASVAQVLLKAVPVEALATNMSAGGEA